MVLKTNYRLELCLVDIGTDLKVPKCEIFDPFFFYTNKFYLGWRLEDWKFFFFLKDYGRYSPFCVFAHAERALKICLCMLSMH
jgi:hypothetical protein